MKKKIVTFILAGAMALSVCSCGNNDSEVDFSQERESSDEEYDEDDEEVPPTEETETSEETEKVMETETEASEEAEEDTFSFADLANYEFYFSSGAGGWGTNMFIHADGSFSGEYSDSDMGSTGEGFPHGTVYQAVFTGQFTQPVKVNEYTYSMQIANINYANEIGTEEIKDGTYYHYTDAYGLDSAETILLYLPGAPLVRLPEEYLSWIGYYDLFATTDTQLTSYGLYNETPQYGFSSYNAIDNVHQMVSAAKESALTLETSIQNDNLTQLEYNEKTRQLYEIWDSALNNVWGVLKQTLDPASMDALTIEEREWIALKEQAVKEAGAAYEGGSMQEMIQNQKAAEMTRDRVYELMEKF